MIIATAAGTTFIEATHAGFGGVAAIALGIAAMVGMALLSPSQPKQQKTETDHD